jgi:hypothetical protein
MAQERNCEYAVLPILEAVGFNLATGWREAVSEPRNEYDMESGMGASWTKAKGSRPSTECLAGPRHRGPRLAAAAHCTARFGIVATAAASRTAS